MVKVRDCTFTKCGLPSDVTFEGENPAILIDYGAQVSILGCTIKNNRGHGVQMEREYGE